MKLLELFGLNDEADEGSAEKKKFDSVVQSRTTRFCHESPAPWKSFLPNGITDETVFCTVNKQSDFVTGEKTRIWFNVPKNIRITPDMRYESYQQILEEHPDITGCDVAVHSKVPLSWIFSIQQVKASGAVVGQWSSD